MTADLQTAGYNTDAGSLACPDLGVNSNLQEVLGVALTGAKEVNHISGRRPSRRSKLILFDHLALLASIRTDSPNGFSSIFQQSQNRQEFDAGDQSRSKGSRKPLMRIALVLPVTLFTIRKARSSW